MMTVSGKTHHPFTLLNAFPWYNKHILELDSISKVREAGLLDVHSLGLQGLVEKLERMEKDVCASKLNHPLRSILLASSSTMIEQRLQTVATLAPERLSSLASNLLEYRLLDVAISLQSGLAPGGQPDCLPIPLPPKMFFKLASHWPRLVVRGLFLLHECGDDPAPDVGPTVNPTQSIFTLLVQRKDTIEGHKIMGNFECVAAYLSLIMKGVSDLPSTMPEFQKLVLSLCCDSRLRQDRWESFFSSIKSVHAFKLPLLLVLSSSVACLFLPSSLMSKDLNRHVLLQMWQGFGGPRPGRLVQVEFILWKALFDVALGKHPLSSRFCSAFREIEMLDLPSVECPDSEWLAGDPSFQESIEKLSHKKNIRKPSPKKQDSGPSGAGQEIPIDSEVGPSRPTTQSVTASQKARPVDVPAVLPIYSSSAPSPRKKGSKKRKSAPARKPSPSISSSDDEFIVRKRTLSRGPEIDETQPPPKAFKSEDGTGTRRVYETIDLTVETRGPPIIDLTIDDIDDVKCFDSVPVMLPGPGSVTHVARFHFAQEAQWFSALCRTIQIGGSVQTFYTIVSPRQMEQMPVVEMQNHFKSGTIIVPGASKTMPLDDASLRALAMLDKPVQMQDFSIPPDRNRSMAGTMKQLLQSIEQSGKSLAGLGLPTPHGILVFPSLASDTYAWHMTIDHPWCHRCWEMPKALLQSAAVSTRDAYRPFGFALNGFATHLEVKSGSQLLLVCHPATFNPHNFFSLSLLEKFVSPFPSDCKTLSFQAFHLKAGDTCVIKPLVPYFLLSMEPSLTYTGHFISTLTLRETCVGFLISSVAAPSQNESQIAAHALLCRLVHYYHLVFLESEYLCNPADFPHVPDISCQDGVIDLLSLCNVFELSNAALYVLSDFERHRTVEARRLSRRIVAWLEARFIFTSQQGLRLEIYCDIWMLFLARQVKALLGYETLVHQHTNPSVYRGKIEACVTNHPDLQAKMAELEAWEADGFAWPDQLALNVSIRQSPGTVPDDIRGEAGDDVNHFI